jgi:hypothetical protein
MMNAINLRKTKQKEKEKEKEKKPVDMKYL